MKNSFEIITIDWNNGCITFVPRWCIHIKSIYLSEFIKGYGIYKCGLCYENDNSHRYTKILEVIENKECKMLTTQKEFFDLNMDVRRKINILGKCGHQYSMPFASFENSAGSCMNCSNVTKKEIIEKNLKIDKNYFNTIETQGNDILKQYITKDFEVIRLMNCSADYILRPLNTTKNLYLPIQVKSTLIKNSNGIYGFSMDCKNYKNMILICICINETKIWLFEGEEIPIVTKINITLKNNTQLKYDKYLIDNNSLSNILLNLYNKGNLCLNKENIDIPVGSSHKSEKIYKDIREKKCYFMKFEYPETESSVYDFIVNGKRVQEKIAFLKKKHYEVNFKKCNGISNAKIPYHEEDNDVYWFHIGNTSKFYVVPTKLLVKLKYISNNEQVGKKTITLNLRYTYEEAKLKKLVSAELNNYIFDYDNIDIKKLHEIFEL